RSKSGRKQSSARLFAAASQSKQTVEDLRTKGITSRAPRPALFLSIGWVRDGRDEIERDQAGGVGAVEQRKQHAGDDRGPEEFARQPVARGRARIGAGRNLAALVLAVHAERQHHEQHRPPSSRTISSS